MSISMICAASAEHKTPGKDPSFKISIACFYWKLKTKYYIHLWIELVDTSTKSTTSYCSTLKLLLYNKIIVFSTKVHKSKFLTDFKENASEVT